MNLSGNGTYSYKTAMFWMIIWSLGFGAPYSWNNQCMNRKWRVKTNLSTKMMGGLNFWIATFFLVDWLNWKRDITENQRVVRSDRKHVSQRQLCCQLTYQVGTSIVTPRGEKKVQESTAYEGPPPTKDKILWCLCSSSHHVTRLAVAVLILCMCWIFGP